MNTFSGFMLRVVLLFTAWSCGTCSAAQTQPEAVKSVIALQPHGMINRDTVNKNQVLLLCFLEDWCLNHTQLTLLSAGRSRAILGDISRGAYSSSEGNLYPLFISRHFVNALLLVDAEGEDLVVRIQTGSGEKKLAIKAAELKQFQKALQKVVAFISTTLALDETATGWNPDKIFLSDHFIIDYYTSRLTPLNPRSSGNVEANLRALQRYWKPTGGAAEKKSLRNLLLCDEIIKCTCNLLKGKIPIKTGVNLSACVLPEIVGSEYEASIAELAALLPEKFEKQLIGMAGGKKVSVSSAPQVNLEDMNSAGETTDALEDSTLDLEVTTADDLNRIAGALRLLGVFKSEASLSALRTAAHSDVPLLRSSVAAALMKWEGEEADKLLQILAKDQSNDVRFQAEYVLWKRGKVEHAPLQAARGIKLDRNTAVLLADTFADAGTAEDLQKLHTLAAFPDERVRSRSIEGLLRLNAIADESYAALLSDHNPDIIKAVLGSIISADVRKHRARCIALANDLQVEVAQAARQALQLIRPTGGVAQMQFDLEVEHPYIRRIILQNLVKENSADAVDLVVSACGNQNPRTRALALDLLDKLDSGRAIVCATTALTDSHLRVRLHAAAILAKAKAADLKAEPLTAALQREKDPAIKSYLQVALQHLGADKAVAHTAARDISQRNGITWGMAGPAGMATSPFTAYYSLQAEVTESWRKAYQAGKIFFPRISTTRNSGYVLLDPSSEDGFWLPIARELPVENLPYIDGIVFGEETMSGEAEDLWSCGWRLFCLEKKIPIGKVNGKKEALTPWQLRAWKVWAQARIVDGFNEIYDYVKLRYHYLRPGLQVATFLMRESGDFSADLRWKFDVAGIYDYKGCNRIAAYLCVRRCKTLWPERPVMWLSHGIGCYEVNPVWYHHKAPSSPIVQRTLRTYTDSISAWMAGADPGWFSTWIFVRCGFDLKKHDLSGVQLFVEDIYTDVLDKAVNYSFNGVEAMYRKKQETAELKSSIGQAPSAALQEDEAEDDLGLIEEEKPEVVEDDLKKQVEKEREKLRLGFKFYGKYVFDCARLFNSLPRIQEKPESLLIQRGVIVWTQPGKTPLAAGMSLPDACDFVNDINKLPGLPIDRYRYIAAHDPGAVTDGTINTLNRWLQKTPGLLYIHKNITPENSEEAGYAEGPEGQLTQDWNWEKTVNPVPYEEKKSEVKSNGKDKKPVPPLHFTTPDGKVALGCRVLTTFTVNGADAQVLLAYEGKPVLVYWKQPTMKGGVLFDGVTAPSVEYLEFVRKEINRIASTGVGKAFTAPMLHQRFENAELIADVTSRYLRAYEGTASLPGLDLLTGERMPSVNPGGDGAIVATKLSGTYVYSDGGFALLASMPLRSVSLKDGVLHVDGGGLVRVACLEGTPVVQSAPGKELPIVAPEEMMNWMFEKADEGQYSPTPQEKSGPLLYYRAEHPVRISVKK